MLRAQTLFPFTLVLALLLVGCASEEGSSSEQMAEGHEGDTPTATEAAQAPDVPVDGRSVVYSRAKAGPDITGYLAAPTQPDSILESRGLSPDTTRLPGVVVIHEWWGLNENIRAATRRLAGEGYRALAVDLYGDSTASTPDGAQALMQKATQNEAQIVANIRDAHEYLLTEAEAPRVGVMGWCFGGGMTFRAVADRPTTFDAAVAYYGTPESMTKTVLQRLTTPVLALFGTTDQVVSMAQVKSFRARVDETGADVQSYTYEAGYAFANPSGQNYEPASAQEAWSRTATFLRDALYGPVNQ